MRFFWVLGSAVLVFFVVVASSWRGEGLSLDAVEPDFHGSKGRESDGAEGVSADGVVKKFIAEVDFASSTLDPLEASGSFPSARDGVSTVAYDVSGLVIPEQPSAWPRVDRLSFASESDPVVDPAARPVSNPTVIEKYEGISFVQPDDPKTWPSRETSWLTEISKVRFVQPDDPSSWQTNPKVFQLPANSPFEIDPDDPDTW